MNSLRAGEDKFGRAGLIGHTGFVGGTLAAVTPFDACFNSRNIDDIRGQHFDLLVCAGVSAAKWLANKDPEADRAGIARLTDALAEATAREVVLISTIDVYPDPANGSNEDAAIDPDANHAYGRQRLRLERWIAHRFPAVRIVRLPALFGPGLRKNALYDLLHGNLVHQINPAAIFQWYPTVRLWRDIETARAAGLKLVNLFPEPLRMSRITEGFFPGARVGPERLPAPRYDLRTRHAALFGGSGGYIMDAESVVSEMSRFIAEQRANAPEDPSR